MASSRMVVVELKKLSRMLRLMFTHDRAWLTGVALATAVLVRALVKAWNRRYQLERFIVNTVEVSQKRAGSRSSSDLRLLARSLDLRRSRSHGRLQALSLSQKEHMEMVRSRSREHLSSLLKQGRSSLCEDCFSRVSSHASLTALAEDEETAEEMGGHCTAAIEPHSCTDVNCRLCHAEVTSWRTLFWRFVGGSAAIVGSYMLWLRFIADEATALAHLKGIVWSISKLFRYKVVNADAIPRSGQAMIVVYHGFIPIDMYFLHAFLRMNVRDDVITMVADFVFRIPFFGYIVRLGGGVPANREMALKHLKNGGLLVVAPGGVREAMTTTAEDYAVRCQCQRFGRSGFASVAQASQSPIVPLFTRNIREVFLVLGGGIRFVQRLYDTTKLPFTPFLGPMLLPLTSFVGEALPFDSKADTKVVAQRAHDALQALMRAHA